MADLEFTNPRLTIAIIGFGNFGQFLGKRFASQGHRVIGFSRHNYHEKAGSIGCEFFKSAHLLLDQNPDVVVFAVSMMSLDIVLSKFPTNRLGGCLVVDVLSVKLYPQELLLRHLPSDSDILCTHPMFGPESGKASWKNLPFMYSCVRINQLRRNICDQFLQIWMEEGCRMVNMSSQQHDEYAASTQFITHTTGRMLNEVGVGNTPIDTQGYGSLLKVVDSTCKDSDDLFYGLFKYNPKARVQLDKLESAIHHIRSRLENMESDEEKTVGETILAETPKHTTLSDEVLEQLIQLYA